MTAIDKLIAPTQELQAKVQLPPGESSAKLLDRVAAGLLRRLASRNTADSPTEPHEMPPDGDESIDIEATEVPSPGLIQIANDSDPDDS